MPDKCLFESDVKRMLKVLDGNGKDGLIREHEVIKKSIEEELFDIKTTGFDWKDIKFTMIGGGIAVIFWLIFILSGINDYAGLM